MVVGRFFFVILGLNPEQGPGLETVHSPIDKLFVRVNFLQGIGLVWFGLVWFGLVVQTAAGR